jgi:phage regulator Rha-like protein
MSAMSKPGALVPVEIIERRIYLIRGQKVMLDSDLAELYHVETRALVQAVKRNLDRFPEDFMFQLSPEEAAAMRSQSVTASKRNVRYQPYAFTEHGVAMLSSVLHGDRAAQVNILIVRAFVKLRELLSNNKDLAHKLEAIERTQKEHGAHINAIWNAIQKLIEPPKKRQRPIGFVADSGKK